MERGLLPGRGGLTRTQMSPYGEQVLGIRGPEALS